MTPARILAIGDTPELHLHQINRDEDSGLLIEANADFYRQALFLDQRALSEKSIGAWLPLAGIRKTILGLSGKPAPAHFIFHIGHCGSTLISRLLEETGGVLALREPLVLRTLSENWQELDDKGSTKPGMLMEKELEFHYRLLSRTFESQQVAMIKATSFTSNLGAAFLAMNPANRALLLAMSANAYVSIMLGAENYAADLRGFASIRYNHLHNLLGQLDFTLGELSLGELAGLAWLVEILKLHAITIACPGQALFQDFDHFLIDTDSSLRVMNTFFGLANDQSTLDRLLESTVLRRYSKAPQYPFDATARRQRIEAARQTAELEIEKGLALIKTLAGSRDEIGRAMTHFDYAIE